MAAVDALPKTAMSASELEAILAVAVRAARAAGALILEHSGRVAIAATKADAADLVTEVDVRCNEVIKASVAAAFPAHAFLGEEDVAPGSAAAAASLTAALGQAQFLWVVDPIDGTTNFVCGLPLSCVSIGVARDGVVVVAVIYEPFRNELFTATLGGGARLNGVPCAVAGADVLARCVLGFGTHHTPHVARAMVKAAGAVSPHCRGLRALGSAALMMAYVANGRLGGFFEVREGVLLCARMHAPCWQRAERCLPPPLSCLAAVAVPVGPCCGLAARHRSGRPRDGHVWRALFAPHGARVRLQRRSGRAHPPREAPRRRWRRHVLALAVIRR